MPATIETFVRETSCDRCGAWAGPVAGGRGARAWGGVLVHMQGEGGDRRYGDLCADCTAALTEWMGGADHVPPEGVADELDSDARTLDRLREERERLTESIDRLEAGG